MTAGPPPRWSSTSIHSAFYETLGTQRKKSFRLPWASTSAGEFRGGVQLITSRVSYSVFNIALLTDPVSDMDSELDRRIQLAGNHYRGEATPVVLLDLRRLPGPPQLQTPDAGLRSARGLICIAESPGMEAPDLVPTRRALPTLEYRRVQDSATRTAFSHIVSQCFHIPTPIAQTIYEAPEPWSHRLEVWLGYKDGAAVTSTALIEEAGAIGIYSVATLPAFARPGPRRSHHALRHQ